MSIIDNKSYVGDSFFAIQTGLLQEFDTFVVDSGEFIDQFYVHQQRQPVSVASKLAFWSNRKLGSRLQKLLNALNKREEYFDAHLRCMMDESLTNVSSLSLQAAHLKYRLSSCIQFNKKEMELLGAQMSELQGLSYDLSKGDKDTKDILHFVNEIIVQGDAQLERNLMYFTMETDIKGVIGFTTKDRSLVIRRLHMIREVQGQTSSIFAEILELYKKHQGILRICQSSYNLLCEIPSDVVYDLRYEPNISDCDSKSSQSHHQSGDSLSVVLVPPGEGSTSGTGTATGSSSSCIKGSGSGHKNDHLIGALEKYFLQPDETLSCLLTKSNLKKSHGNNGTNGSVKKERSSLGEYSSSRRDKVSSDTVRSSSLSIDSPGDEKHSQLSCKMVERTCPLSDTAVSFNYNNGSSSSGSGNGDRAVTVKAAENAFLSTDERETDSGTQTNADAVDTRMDFNDGIHRNSINGTDFLDISGGIENKAVTCCTSSIEEQKNETPGYDHTQCCDCSVVDDLARDCVTRLSAMHRKAAESFGRLEKLLEIREEFININMCMRARKTF